MLTSEFTSLMFYSRFGILRQFIRNGNKYDSRSRFVTIYHLIIYDIGIRSISELPMSKNGLTLVLVHQDRKLGGFVLRVMSLDLSTP